jgi:GTP-binding protein
MQLESTFIKSSVLVSEMPKPTLPEYAFIGRSNVGKSSLINMITGQKSLAKTSSSPGKTQTVNHFLIQKSWYLVDLPGYGYAKVSKKEREKWQLMIRKYLQNRTNLLYVCLLIDSRHEPQKVDLDFAVWLGELNIPFVVVFTKTDKLGASSVQKNAAAFKKALLQWWTETPPFFLTSAESKAGRDELLNFIKENNLTYAKAITASQNE